MKQLFIMLLLVLTSCVQSNKVSDEGSRKIVETFFVTYESAGAEKALNEIFATNINFLKLPTHSIDELREKLKSCENTMGKYFGYEIIAKRVIGKTIVHYSCIMNSSHLGIHLRCINQRIDGCFITSNLIQN